MSTFYPYFQPNQGWWGNVLRAIMGRGGGKFRNNNYNYFPFGKMPILIDTAPGSLMKVASEVPHLNTVLSTGAEFFSLMKIKHLDKNGEEIENSKVLKFLRKPNVIQTLEQYLYEFYINNGVYNKTFQHQVKGLSFEKIPSALWILPTGWMQINVTGKLYRQTRIEDIIESYEFRAPQMDSEFFEVDKVIYMSEGLGNNPLNPISRVEALQIPLSNIMASLKSRNIIVSERGMIGFISHNNSSAGGDQQAPDTEEHKRMRTEYQSQYDLDSRGGHVGFTTNDVKWIPMTFDIKQLGLIEGTEDDFAAIIASLRHDRDIYPSIKGATYENKAAGLRYTVQNGLQPTADKLMAQWTYSFCEEGERLIACYDHLPCMKEDERLAAQGRYYEAQANEILFNNGIINADSFAEEMDIEMTGDGKVIQRSSTNNNTP